MSVKRPRINDDTAALIERVRGGVPFERFVNEALGEHLTRYRLGARELAKLAGDESGLTKAERRELYAKIDANAVTGKAPRDGLTDAENRAFNIMGRYLPTNHDDAEVFRRLFWGS